MTRSYYWRACVLQGDRFWFGFMLGELFARSAIPPQYVKPPRAARRSKHTRFLCIWWLRRFQKTTISWWLLNLPNKMLYFEIFSKKENRSHHHQRFRPTIVERLWGWLTNADLWAFLIIFNDIISASIMPLRQALRNRLNSWRDLLSSQPESARMIHICCHPPLPQKFF